MRIVGSKKIDEIENEKGIKNKEDDRKNKRRKDKRKCKEKEKFKRMKEVDNRRLINIGRKNLKKRKDEKRNKGCSFKEVENKDWDNWSVRIGGKWNIVDDDEKIEKDMVKDEEMVVENKEKNFWRKDGRDRKKG